MSPNGTVRNPYELNCDNQCSPWLLSAGLGLLAWPRFLSHSLWASHIWTRSFVLSKIRAKSFSFFSTKMESPLWFPPDRLCGALSGGSCVRSHFFGNLSGNTLSNASRWMVEGFVVNLWTQGCTPGYADVLLPLTQVGESWWRCWVEVCTPEVELSMSLPSTWESDMGTQYMIA